MRFCVFISVPPIVTFLSFNFWKLPNFANTANDDPKPNAKEKENEEQQKLKIDELPDVMLANIASFLDLQSFIHFEQSNRFIFTTIRSMPTMELTDEIFMEYLHFTMDGQNQPFYDLDRFKFSKHLHIDLEARKDLAPLISLRDLSIFQNLSSLKISSDDITPDLEHYICCELKQFESLSNISMDCAEKSLDLLISVVFYGDDAYEWIFR